MSITTSVGRESRESSIRQMALLRQEQSVRKYLDEARRVLERVSVASVRRVITVLISAYLEDRQIFIMGNGGSAATASHFANDINKSASVDGKRRFRAIALTDNVPLLTALGNDLSYDDIFVEQLKNLYRDGAIVIGISGSGKSENVLKAVRYAKSRGGTTIGFTGADGNKLGDIVDRCIMIPCRRVAQVEDAHLVLEHAICRILREEVALL
jgi:D-sedoheptulose 7-phosphate isomerase